MRSEETNGRAGGSGESAAMPGTPIQPGSLHHGSEDPFRGCVWQPHTADVTSLAEVRHVVQELQRTDGVKDPGDMVSALSFAYRFEPLSLPDGEDPEGFHDGNEAGAGPKLLHVLRQWNLRNVLLVVTRKDRGYAMHDILGPRKFKRIVECAQALIEERYLPSIREAMLGEEQGSSSGSALLDEYSSLEPLTAVPTAVTSGPMAPPPPPMYHYGASASSAISQRHANVLSTATALFGHDVTALEPPSQYSQQYTQAQQQQQHAYIPYQQRQILLPTAQLISSKTVRFPSNFQPGVYARHRACKWGQPNNVHNRTPPRKSKGSSASQPQNGRTEQLTICTDVPRPHVPQSVAHASNQLHDSIGWESTILSDDRRAQGASTIASQSHIHSGELLAVPAPSAEAYWEALKSSSCSLPVPSTPGESPVLDLSITPPRINRQARSQVANLRDPRAETLCVVRCVRGLMCGIRAMDDDWFICRAMLASPLFEGNLRSVDVRCLRREVVDRVMRDLADEGLTPTGMDRSKTRVDRDLLLWIERVLRTYFSLVYLRHRARPNETGTAFIKTPTSASCQRLGNKRDSYHLPKGSLLGLQL